MILCKSHYGQFLLTRKITDETPRSRRYFCMYLDGNQETGTEIVSEVKSRLDQLKASSGESLQLLADNITKQMDKRHREWMDRFTMNENVMFNVVQQMQDLTDAIQTLHEDMRLASKRQALLEKRLRHESIATPESQHLNQNQTQRLRVLIPWEEVQECEMK